MHSMSMDVPWNAVGAFSKKIPTNPGSTYPKRPKKPPVYGLENRNHICILGYLGYVGIFLEFWMGGQKKKMVE